MKRKTPISRIGEIGLVEMFKKATQAPKSSVIVGIGDDTAVLRARGKTDLLFTTDMLIEERHFRLKEATPFEIGRKAMAVNLSDIAAMGGRPTHAVAAVGLPGKLDTRFAKDLHRGLEETARRFGAALVGGDTNESDRVIVSVALLGEVVSGQAVRRTGAKPGDVIFVTGELGGSYASKKHLNFTPRLKEAAYLVKHARPSAMMDISDGLSTDLARLAAASGVGAVIAEEALPIASKASTRGAWSDGEDFELLFTVPPKAAAYLGSTQSLKGLALFSPIGEIVGKNLGLRMKSKAGKWKTLSPSGFEHFK